MKQAVEAREKGDFGGGHMESGTCVNTHFGHATVVGQKGNDVIVRLDKPNPGRPVEYFPRQAVIPLGEEAKSAEG